MTNPTPLSPAAQAVWDAFNEDEAGVFVDYGDKLAAALRAAAHEVAPFPGRYPMNEWMEGFRDAKQSVHHQLLAIAAELDEGAPMTPDFRALCAELVDNIHRGSSGMLGWTSEQEDELLARARAALAEPEGPAPFVIRRDTLDD